MKKVEVSIDHRWLGSVFTGMKDGQKVVFHGEGDQEPGLEPGDIIIVLDQREHSRFTRLLIITLTLLVFTFESYS